MISCVSVSDMCKYRFFCRVSSSGITTIIINSLFSHDFCPFLYLYRSHSNDLVTTTSMPPSPMSMTFSFTGSSSSHSSSVIMTTTAPSTGTTTSICHWWVDFRVQCGVVRLISCWHWWLRFGVGQREDGTRKWTHYVLPRFFNILTYVPIEVGVWRAALRLSAAGGCDGRASSPSASSSSSILLFSKLSLRYLLISWFSFAMGHHIWTVQYR